MAKALAVTADLIFSTKIISTARALGIDAEALTTPAALESRLARGDVRLVIVDMGLPGDAAERAVECAVACGGLEVIAFFSHVQTAQGEAARRAGATRVMPRSKFSAELPELLQASCGCDGPPVSGTAGVNPAARP